MYIEREREIDIDRERERYRYIEREICVYIYIYHIHHKAGWPRCCARHRFVSAASSSRVDALAW